jgi:uncharacterized protein (DUF1499 family)
MKPQSIVGVVTPQLQLCRNRRNCVCSQDRSPTHAIKPLNGLGRVQTAFQLLKTILETTHRCQVIKSTPTYLYAEFRTPLLGLTDDVEFLLAASEDIIHVRSSSRVGYWDLGVNRRRIEKIRVKLRESLKTDAG